MANPEDVAKLLNCAASVDGPAKWNEYLRAVNTDNEDDSTAADLTDADLSGQRLQDFNLSQVDLRRAGLRKTDLAGAHLDGADLSGADLTDAAVYDASLRDAKLANASLVRTDLAWSDLRRTNFQGADLSQANLRGANLAGTWLGEAMVEGVTTGWTIFADTDLSTTCGLDAMVHAGPSFIDVNTIYKSKGAIPEAFLRGAGLPETFIAYARSLVGTAIEFYSCFISHATVDKEFAVRLNADLRASGLRVWFARQDLKVGDRFQERIEESIHTYDKVMIVLSEASVRSRWVQREVDAAREREDREGRTVLFPIRIDDAVMQARVPWAADIRRSRHIGDFSRWKDDEFYRSALALLLISLNAGT